jgi:hypothetical protein
VGAAFVLFGVATLGVCGAFEWHPMRAAKKRETVKDALVLVIWLLVVRRAAAPRKK